MGSAGEERSGGTVNVAPAVHGFVEIVRDLVEVLIDPGVRIPGRTGFEVLVEVTNDAAECGFNLRVVSRWFPWQSRSILGVRGRLVINIMTAVSQWEREAIGERTRDAMQHKKSTGRCVGNIAYGYRLAADGEHVEPEPSEQAALAQILTLRGQGRSLRQIAIALNRQALRTRRGAGWRHDHVLRIIGTG